MTFDDLRRTLAGALETGKTGTPVALRLHLQLSRPEADPATALAAIVDFAEPIFANPPAKLAARRDPDAREWNVLLTYANGQTLLATIGRGIAPAATLNLMLIGNHGIIRLEGGEDFEEPDFPATEEAGRWKSSLDRSIDEEVTVPLV